jgi:hypothetical protein
MKKITPFYCLFLTLFLAFQASAQDRDLTTLLAELQSLGNTPLSEAQVIKQHFNASEGAILTNYINQQSTASEPGMNSAAGGGFIFHVLDVRNDDIFGTLNSAPPYSSINTILSPLPAVCFADDFDQNGVLYGLEFENDAVSGDPISRDLITVDTTDGTVTVIGDLLSSMGGATPTGLAFDFTTNTMYATASDTLYTIDLVDGTATEVGPMGTSTAIWLVIDNDGLAYAADITLDAFYSVDLTTGAATLIGVLGIDISFAQDATINPADNLIYMAAYTGGGTGGVYTVDPTFGVATLVGDTQPLNAEMGMFSVGGVPPLGVEENDISNFSLYPNPATRGVVNIETSTQGEKQVVVMDVLGKTVINTTISGTELNISSLKGGVYMVQVTQNNATATRKLIVN